MRFIHSLTTKVCVCVFFFLCLKNKMSDLTERHDVELLTGRGCQQKRLNESLLGIERRHINLCVYPE